MVNLYSMRSRKDRALRSIARAAHRYGLTANRVTALGLFFGVASGVSLAYREVFLAILLLFASVFCDVVDGTIARTFHLKTKFGLAFDSVADRCTELAVVIGALYSGIILPIGVIAIVGSMALLLMRTVGYYYGLDTTNALFGRVERIALIALGLIILSVPISTLCFVTAGVFGLASSCQIGVSLWRHHNLIAASPEAREP